MANGDSYNMLGAVAGLVAVLTGGHFALVRTTMITKKELDARQKDCQNKLYDQLHEISKRQEDQTAWIMAIANKVGLKNEDVRKL